MANDEDGNDQEKDGRIVVVSWAAFAAVDGNKDSGVENDKKQHWHKTEQHQSKIC